MKKYWFIIFLSLLSCKELLANHTKGGWMYYEYLGSGSTANTARYRITLKMYTVCFLTAQQFEPTINFTAFDAATRQITDNIPVTENDILDIQNCSTQECHPCINAIPTICYKIITYQVEKEFPITSAGFIIAYQRCCRINGIANLQGPTNGVGETWTVNIPGSAVAGAFTNSSAKFSQNDTAIICRNNAFTFDFSATDVDDDSLVYNFTPAYEGGGSGNPTPDPPSTPPFTEVAYASGFSGSQPLGSQVTINSTTGIVSGIAPASGVYVVTVTVSEYRRGTNIKVGEVRKSLHIEVADCSLTTANLLPSYIKCDNFDFDYKNESSSNLIKTWDWFFGDGSTSTQEQGTHTYLAPGTYTLKLVVNRGLACSDSATAVVNVFPGFFPKLKVDGQCKNTPIQFTDLTTATYGSINKWSWTFGDPGSAQNTSAIKSPTHIYSAANTYAVEFTVTSSKGCVGVIDTNIIIKDQPDLTVTHDTLICSIDTLQLHATGSGSFVWTPNYNISSTTDPDPLVSPDVTTTYRVQLTDPFGCVGNGAVKVKVVDFVTLNGPPDTLICRTDPIILNEVSDGLHFVWTPDDGSINNTGILRPTVRPLSTTTYHVVATIGKCVSQDDIKVTPIPYPVAYAGPNVPLCLGFSTQLHATGGAYYAWSPSLFLDNARIPDPKVITPTTGVRYIVTVRDTLGCPKPVSDTVIVNVIKINAGAGPRDTSVVLGQPLQLSATGGTHYTWLPDNRWLSSTIIPNPVALPQNDILYNVRVSDDNGCIGTASIQVYLYNLKAGLYIPNAFTPNGDGHNDYFKPIELGISTLDLFNVYNRFGELLYSTTSIKNGWDGTYKGKAQDPGTYVWYAEGTDYTGKKLTAKGSVILIR